MADIMVLYNKANCFLGILCVVLRIYLLSFRLSFYQDSWKPVWYYMSYILYNLLSPVNGMSRELLKGIHVYWNF